MKDRITDVPTGLSMDEAYKTYVETLFEINENERLNKENNEGSQVFDPWKKSLNRWERIVKDIYIAILNIELFTFLSDPALLPFEIYNNVADECLNIKNKYRLSKLKYETIVQILDYRYGDLKDRSY